MKMISIIAIILFFNPSIKAQGEINHASPCPEQKISDLVYVNYFLSDPKFDAKKKKLGVEANRAKLKDFDTNDLNGLKSYLENRGVFPVTTDTTCQNIGNILKEKQQHSIYKGDFRTTFFSLDSRYLIIFIPLKENQNRRKGGWPLLVLDKDFKVVDEFLLQ